MNRDFPTFGAPTSSFLSLFLFSDVAKLQSRSLSAPESSGPRCNFVLLGDRIDSDYKVGHLQLDADAALRITMLYQTLSDSIIAVTEVDGAVLVAVLEAL